MPKSATAVALATALLTIALAAPVAAAQDADVDESKRKTSLITFYGHVFGGTRFFPMPMNVEFPWGEEDFSAGYGDTCGVSALDAVTPLPASPPVGPDPQGDCENEPLNEIWFYSTAGFVNIVDSNDFDYAKIHNERGLTKDTFLDTTQDVTATAYMSADGHGWSTLFCNFAGTKPHDLPEPVGCWNWDPGVLPQWTIRATLFTAVLGEYGGEANTPPDIVTAYESGKLEVLAEGASTPVDVMSMEAVGQPTVWKFDINLGKPKTAVIPKEKSYLVRFEFWSDMSGNKVVLPPNWNFNSGELYPPSITIPVKNAFDVESVIPQFVHGKLAIHGIINTPWGSYDVDQNSVKLTIVDAKGDETQPVRLVKLADYSVAHGGHYKPVNVSYVWDYKGDKLKPGAYTATISATNYQHSASSECAAKFEIRADGSPGPITVGQCAVQTISDAQLEKIQEGIAGSQTGGGADGGDGGKALPGVPGVPVRIAAASAVPVAGAGALPMLAALALAAVAVLLHRRWSS